MQPSLEQEIQKLESRLEAEGERDGRAFVPLADAYRRAGSLDRAAELVEEWRDRYPNLTAGHLVAGRVFREREEAEAAESAYRRVLELEGEHPEALQALAAIAEDDGREVEARELYHRWALADPDDGRAREGLRRLKRRHFRELLEDAPEDEPEAPDREAGSPSPPDDAGPPASEEPDEPSPEDREEREPAVYTRTMAELYARQGLTERAAEVYRRLLEESPDDASLRERLEALETRGAPDGPSRAAMEAATADREVRSEEEMEDLARDWATGPEETGSLDSPFAWGEEEAPGDRSEGSVPQEGPTAAAYFDRLLEAQEEPEPEAKPEPGAAPSADADGGEAEPLEAGSEADDADPLDDASSSDDFRRWLEGLGP